MKVLDNDTKRMQWLHMQATARLMWMIKQVDKMHQLVELINTWLFCMSVGMFACCSNLECFDLIM